MITHSLTHSLITRICIYCWTSAATNLSMSGIFLFHFLSLLPIVLRNVSKWYSLTHSLTHSRTYLFTHSLPQTFQFYDRNNTTIIEKNALSRIFRLLNEVANSLTHSLTHSLTPSLPNSLPPSLPHSLPHSLPPSLTPSLPHSLFPPSLTHSFPIQACFYFGDKNLSRPLINDLADSIYTNNGKIDGYLCWKDNIIFIQDHPILQMCVDTSLTHSLTHLLTHPLTHLLTHPLTHDLGMYHLCFKDQQKINICWTRS